MRTSATGTSTSSPPPHQRGFTLIEILVVMLIIGIMVVGAVLSSSVAHGDRELEQERDRIIALAAHLRDQASLQNREFGMRCFQGGYEFLVFNARTGLWQRDAREDTMRARHLPQGLQLTVSIDARPVVLPRESVKDDELRPQVLFYSSGELNQFEIILEREQAGPGVRIAPAPEKDEVEAVSLATNTP